MRHCVSVTGPRKTLSSSSTLMRREAYSVKSLPPPTYVASEPQELQDKHQIPMGPSQQSVEELFQD